MGHRRQKLAVSDLIAGQLVGDNHPRHGWRPSGFSVSCSRACDYGRARSGPGVRSSGRTTLPSYVGGDPPGDKWHLDEVFVKINGTTHYLWRAVDQHGNVLDILVQSRRNAPPAET